MLVKRSAIWHNHSQSWCPQCAKKVDFEHHPTGMPGIAANKCPECQSVYQYNFLESGDDLLEVGDLVMAPNPPA